jgi:hypothetical protein
MQYRYVLFCAARTAHLVEDHIAAAVGELQSGLTSGETSTRDMNHLGLSHSGRGTS